MSMGLRSLMVKYVMIIFLCALVLMVSGCSTEEKKEASLREQIKNANYCQSDEDCAFVGHQCPFGCYIYVNQNEREDISAKLQSFNSRCTYSCINCQGVACINRTCVPQCQGP